MSTPTGNEDATSQVDVVDKQLQRVDNVTREFNATSNATLSSSRATYHSHSHSHSDSGSSSPHPTDKHSILSNTCQDGAVSHSVACTGLRLPSSAASFECDCKMQHDHDHDDACDWTYLKSNGAIEIITDNSNDNTTHDNDDPSTSLPSATQQTNSSPLSSHHQHEPSSSTRHTPSVGSSTCVGTANFGDMSVSMSSSGSGHVDDVAGPGLVIQCHVDSIVTTMIKAASITHSRSPPMESVSEGHNGTDIDNDNVHDNGVGMEPSKSWSESSDSWASRRNSDTSAHNGADSPRSASNSEARREDYEAVRLSLPDLQLAADAPIAPAINGDFASTLAPTAATRPKPDEDPVAAIVASSIYNHNPTASNDWRVRFAADIAASQAIGSDWSALEAMVNGGSAIGTHEATERAEDRRRRSVSLHQLEGQSRVYIGRPLPIALSHRYNSNNTNANTHTSQPNGSAAPDPPQLTGLTTFSCGICQEENIPLWKGERFGLQVIRRGVRRGQEVKANKDGSYCTHRFCDECLRQYLEHQITNGEVLRIRCPGRDESGGICMCIAPSSWLQNHLTTDMWQRYQRFLQLRLDENYRSCPNVACMHVQKRGESTVPDHVDGLDCMKCVKCDTVYCFRHDLAHANGPSCRDYQRQLDKESKESVSYIGETSVRCPWPTCRVRCTKADGCNHLQCPRCNTEFCYLCGGFYLGGLHFATLNLLGCPGLKSDVMGPNSRATWPRFFFKLFIGLPITLILMVLALALFLAVESIYLVWVFGLLPVWIVWGVLVCCMEHGSTRNKYERRLNSCVTWGAKLIGGMCGC